MSNGVNVYTVHSLVGCRWSAVHTISDQNHECLRNANYAARPRPPQAATSNSGISCRNWPASRCSINSFIAETKSVNSNFLMYISMVNS